MSAGDDLTTVLGALLALAGRSDDGSIAARIMRATLYEDLGSERGRR